MTVVADFRALLYANEDDGHRWNAMADRGAPVFVTYSFADGAELPDEAIYAPFENDGYNGFNAAQRDSFRTAVEHFEDVTGVVFVEVESGGMIDAFSTSGSVTGGWAHIPHVDNSGCLCGCALVIDNPDPTYAPGTYAYATILHELGHTLGLQHPHDGSIQLERQSDDTANTVMSYNVTGIAAKLGLLDIAALQHLYGGSIEGRHPDWQWDWDERADRFELTGAGRNDVLVGVDATNVIRGRRGNDDIYGRGEDDRLFGGRGQDELRGGAGADDLRGGVGADRLFGDLGDDLLVGGAGGDALYGGAGDDRLIGGGDDDRLYGGGGDDVIIGGAGRDRVSGNGGADQFVFRSGDAWNAIQDFQIGTDRLHLPGADIELANGGGDLLLRLADHGLAIKLVGIAAGSATLDEVSDWIFN
ncbi:MAG: hypothetical protein AAGE18_01185 [Pseudomonadota bacterium]